MRRLAALLVLCALACAGPAAAIAPRASVLGLETELVCVTCHEPLYMSTSPLAQQMKRFIREKVAAGWTGKQIEDYFVAELGPQVLAVPGTHGFDLLAWLLPLVGIVAGIVVVGGGAWVWSHNRDEDADGPAAPGSGLPAGLDFRVDQELARFDA